MDTKHWADWTINSLLAIIFVLLVAFYTSHFEPKAWAAGGGLETNGVMAMTTNGPTNYLVLIDTVKKNIMVYKAHSSGELNLLGARSYKYDVELKDTSASLEIKRGATAKQIYDIYKGKR